MTSSGTEASSSTLGLYFLTYIWIFLCIYILDEEFKAGKKILSGRIADGKKLNLAREKTLHYESAKHTNRKYCILPEMKTFGKTMVKWKILREEIFLSTLNLQGCLIQCQKIGQMQVVSQWSDSSGTLARPMMNRSRTHHAEISTFA
ncbi:uncharacterized protein LOC143830273 isoform X3 [Paroedura picta]|uniref:uncharacterized protein LOC143830273 isoform X3 n=1 Tax=Paroedura picta TaxID=143630 RepID=UPI004056E034